MHFPVDITFKLMGWRARVQLSDAGGQVFGYASFDRRAQGELPVYADEGMIRKIHAIKWNNASAQWFENSDGEKIGEFGGIATAGGKFVLIDGDPRYTFVDETPWIDFAERMVPNVPVVNGVAGALFKPSSLAVRCVGGQPVLRLVKTRLMIDIRYRLHLLGELDAREQHCLMLASMVQCLWDHYINFSRL